MGLFDNGMPMGMQHMIKTLLQAAAPDLAKQVDDVAVAVASFNAKLDRVIALQRLIINHFQIEDDHAGSGSDERKEIAGTSFVGHSGPTDGTGKSPGE